MVICQKCCIFSSIFNIKMATEKIYQFWCFFKCMLIWHVTKLFQMKLKMTKCCLQPSYRKNTNKHFGQTNNKKINLERQVSTESDHKWHHNSMCGLISFNFILQFRCFNMGDTDHRYGQWTLWDNGYSVAMCCVRVHIHTLGKDL